MKFLLSIISLLFVVSCKQNLSERYYRSSDDVTGGFNDFSLALHSDGKFELTIKTSIAEGQEAEGALLETKTKTVTGKWEMNNQTINYSIVESKSSIDSIWVNTSFDFSNKPIIVFSQKLDTVYIYGIPCIEVQKQE